MGELRRKERGKEKEGPETQGIPLEKRKIHGIEVWTTDISERGTHYRPNPYPVKRDKEEKK